MQSRSIKPPTKAERKRMERIVSLGCVACIRGKVACSLAVEVNHLLDGGVRIGHHATVPLCSWHHRGVAFEGIDKNRMAKLFGPSFYHDAREFRDAYGDDNTLLVFTDLLLSREDLL